MCQAAKAQCLQTGVFVGPYSGWQFAGTLAECNDISRLTDVSLLTGQEPEFLASLNTRWRSSYCNELARLLNPDDKPRDGRHEPSIIRISAACSRHSRRDPANATKA